MLCHESITDILVFEYGSDLSSYEQYLSSSQLKTLFNFEFVDGKIANIPEENISTQ